MPTPPAPTFSLASDTGSSGIDRVTRDGTIYVYGIQYGAKWEYSIGGSWLRGTGSSFLLPSGIYAVGSIKVRQTDADGNISPESSNYVAIVVDIKPPIAPTFVLAADTGKSSSDWVTKNGRVNVAGLEPSALWRYSINGGASWITGGSGNFFTLSPGVYKYGSVWIQQIDLAGNMGLARFNAKPIVVDTTAPLAPIMTLAVDTGKSANDGITTNGRMLVYGIEPDATWEYRFGGTGWTVGTKSMAFTLTPGTYSPGSIKVRQTDLAGNISPEGSNTESIVVDTTPPPAPTFTLEQDTGKSSTDGITKTGKMNVSGIEPGAIWEYNAGGKKWIAGSGATFTLPPNTYRAGSIKIRQTDAAGNISPEYSNPAKIIVDITPPVALKFALAEDTGSSAKDAITKNGRVNVSGFETGAIWEYSINSGASWVTGSGNFFTLSPGTYAPGKIGVRQTDLAGNIGEQRFNGNTIIVDVTPPQAPILTLFEDTGRIHNDGVTQNGLIVVSNLQPGSVWEYSLDGGSRWTVGRGESFTLAPGTYLANSIRVRQTDPAGNTSYVNSIGTIVVDRTKPPAPKFALVNDTGRSSKDNITNNGMVNVSGIVENAIWRYTLDGGLTWLTSSGSTFAIPPGTYAPSKILVQQEDLAGNTSTVSRNTATIIVDTTAPTAPTFALAQDTGASASDGVTKNGRMNVAGIETNAIWEYTINGGTTWLKGRGTFFTLPVGTYPENTIKVRQTDVAGNISDETSNNHPIVVDTAVPAAPTLVVAPSGEITVSGLVANCTWEYSSNGGKSWTIGTGETFTLSPGLYAAGAIRVRQTDLAGNVSPVQKNSQKISIGTL